MNCVFYSNGIIIQGVNNIPDNYSSDDIFPFGYYGIERYVTWPLEYEEDSTSMMLSNEISQKWLSDDIFSLYTVNDQDLLYRYAENCSKLKLPIRCLLVESPSKFPVASMSLPHKNILGYEYVDTDMQTSCMYEDFTDQTPMVRKALSTAVQGLNEYGLFSCINRIEQYLAIRTALIKEGYDMESYYHPQIVRIREVHLPRSI